MSRILLVTRDAACRQELSEAFSALGHRVEVCADPAEVASRAAEVVVVDNDLTCSQGRQVVRTLAAADRPRRLVVWTGAGVSTGLGPVFTELPDAVLSPPLGMATVGAVLSRLERGSGRPGDTVDLDAVDGPVDRYPPLRVLWAAHRARACGRLELYLDDMEHELFFQDGRLVGGRGFPQAMAAHGVEGEEEDDLGALMARAIATGARPDQVLEDAARAVGRVIASTVGRSGGMVFFDPRAELPQGAVALPTPIPVMIGQALREVRPLARAQELLGPLRGDLVVASQKGSDPGGLPPVALRLWRAATEPQKLGVLLSQDDEAWLAADLLLQLGLVRLASPPPEPAPPPAEAPPARKRERKPAADGKVDELVAERARLRELDALGVLGITRSEELEPRAIDERFRLLSSRFHPDRYARESEAVLTVARDCFALVNDAYAVLRDEAVRHDAQQRMQAREQGRHYSNESDKRRARLLYAQGELAFRRKQYAEAQQLLAQAAEAHGDDWKIQFLLERARFEARASTAEACASALMKISAPEGRARAEVLYHLGEMLLAADREKAAFKAFEDAIAQFPDHIEAKRRLRLRELRAGGVHQVRAKDAEERARRAEERSREAVLDGTARKAAKAAADPAGTRAPSVDDAAAKVSGLLSGLFKRKDG
ncbi:hypothetical protein L6R53_17655 [Myxococcota bacterium]|nr:hypothetical protein [Myxococcota bacterium]